MDEVEKRAIRNNPYPFNIREEMGIKLLIMEENYPESEPWKQGLPSVDTMLNSATHPDGKRALELVVRDTIDAHDRGTPTELIQTALSQVVEWRRIMLKTQPRDEPTVGSITVEKLKKELKGKLPDDYIAQIFP